MVRSLMRIDGDDDCWFTLEPLETDPMGRRDVRAGVSFAGRGFAASNSSVWFDGDAITSFLAALRQLDAKREGNATLETMSPNECVLAFRNSDGLGHLLLDVSITAGIGTQQSTCNLSFSFDPTSFPALVKQIEAALVV